MKAVVLCLLLTAGLAGCASKAPRITPASDVDFDKIAAIERVAAREGVQVIWVNRPRKATP
ncbi:MAG TPA: hypothetical protein VF169_00985 [Albitalea sp.]|uniref:hypothetical protein n=1 Tax=Piscinibacter sp. TaxID=1903157 RepID=UPI002ED40251